MTVQEASPPNPKHTRRSRYWLAGGVLLSVMLLGLFAWLHFLAPHETDPHAALKQELASLKETAATQDAALASLRQQLDSEAERLGKIEQHSFTHNPALARTYAALSDIDTDLDSLALAGKPSTPAPSPTPPPEDTPQNGWQQVIHVLQQVWHQLVTVRHIKAGEDILIPETRRLVILRLHGEIASAKWALLHGEPAIYAKALANVRQLLAHDFANETVDPLLLRLNALDSPPEIPDTSSMPADSP